VKFGDEIWDLNKAGGELVADDRSVCAARASVRCPAPDGLADCEGICRSVCAARV
jgi:hypothetical protein